MPRPNVSRSIASESNLARRIAHEREARGLSYEGLAKLMTEAGCSIQGSAIYKIEKGDPPRRITVDELVALSTVLGLSVDELLTPMEVLQQQRARELVAKLQPAYEALGEATERLFNMYAELFEYAAHDHDLYEYVTGHWFSTGERESQHPLGTYFENDEAVEGDDLADLAAAMQAFTTAIVQSAGERVGKAVVAKRTGSKGGDRG